MSTELEKIINSELDSVLKFEKLLDLLLHEFISNHNLAAVFINEQSFFDGKKNTVYKKHYDKFYELVTELFNFGIQNNAFSSELNIEIIMPFIIGGLRSIIHQHIQGKKKYNMDELKTAILNLVKKGLLKA